MFSICEIYILQKYYIVADNYKDIYIYIMESYNICLVNKYIVLFGICEHDSNIIGT